MSLERNRPLHGRGASSNPRNRFERLDVVYDSPGPDRIDTDLFRDSSRSILSRNQSPDVPFEVSLNPYRGCEHGCIYCYARPSHEHLGFSAGLDFETKILVKEDAADLLRRELESSKWQPQVIALSGVTDAYQPIERRLRVTRRCLEVLAELQNPVSIITKNRLVCRDADLLGRLAESRAASVLLSLTTLNVDLARRMEPRATSPHRRLEAIARLRQEGIPCGALIAPVIPGLNDHEIPALLDSAAAAGATFARYVLLRLPLGVAPLFERWLGEHFPDRKKKVLNRIRETRDGSLYDSRFGHRMRGHGVFADQIARLFEVSRRRAGLSTHGPELSTASFKPSGPRQTSLFEG